MHEDARGMTDGDQPIEGLVADLRDERISRGRFMAVLGGLGASAAGIAALVASGESRRPGAARLAPPADAAKQAEHHRLHEAHVSRQAAATTRPAVTAQDATMAANAAYVAHLKAIMDDYADDAVVEDPMFDRPIRGKAAIAERKLAEMGAMRDVKLDVTHRFVHGDQVVAEWVLEGRHDGHLHGYAPSGKQVVTRGVTVVTRRHGKIVRESLHYDVAHMHRQLSDAGSA